MIVTTLFAASLSILTCVSAGCANIVDAEGRIGCSTDSECGVTELCTVYKTCVAISIDDGTKQESLSPAPAAEPDTSAPEVPVASEPESDTPESDTPEEGAPETTTENIPSADCIADTDCGDGRACVEGTCEVGCNGVPARGVCTTTELQFCVNPGLPGEGVTTASLADPVCLGDRLVDSCSATGEPQGILCSSEGGACFQGACVTLPEGALCNDTTMTCGNDDNGVAMQCAGKDAFGAGTCQSGCGDIPEGGVCEGATVRYCADVGLASERIESYTCTGGDVCGDVRDDFSGCVAGGQGATCFDANVDDIFHGCGGDGDLSCEIDTDTDVGTCVPGAASCNMEATAPECLGDNLVYSCYGGQPLVVDCSDLGGSCGDGACEGVDRGENCNGVDLLCGFGLFCYAPNNSSDFGTCDF